MTNFEFSFKVISEYQTPEIAFNDTDNPEESRKIFLNVVNPPRPETWIKFLFTGHAKEEWLERPCISDGRGKIILTEMTINDNFPCFEGVRGKIPTGIRYYVTKYSQVRWYDGMKLQAIEYQNDEMTKTCVERNYDE